MKQKWTEWKVNVSWWADKRIMEKEVSRVQSCHNLLLQQLMIQRETVNPRLPHSGMMTKSLQSHYKGLRRKYERRQDNSTFAGWINVQKCREWEWGWHKRSVALCNHNSLQEQPQVTAMTCSGYIIYLHISEIIQGSWIQCLAAE